MRILYGREGVWDIVREMKHMGSCKVGGGVLDPIRERKCMG